jgi:hypothetical protein
MALRVILLAIAIGLPALLVFLISLPGGDSDRPLPAASSEPPAELGTVGTYWSAFGRETGAGIALMQPPLDERNAGAFRCKRGAGNTSIGPLDPEPC